MNQLEDALADVTAVAADDAVADVREDVEKLRPKAQQMADILKSMAHPNRLLILCFLRDKAASVGEITEFLSMSQPAVSQTLSRMKQEKILDSHQIGQKVIYSVNDKIVLEVMGQLERLCNDILLEK